MNYAIIARNVKSQQFGIALKSVQFGEGLYLDAAIKPGLGAILIEGKRSLRINRLATNLLSLGHTAQQVMNCLRDDDTEFEDRYILIMDQEGDVAAYGGTHVRSCYEVKQGANYAAISAIKMQGGIAGRMAAEFEKSGSFDFDERLLRALEVVDVNEGPGQGSAALCVYGFRSYSDVDLRVDYHRIPVKELRRIYMEFKPTAKYYEDRARDPRNAPNALEFAGLLSRGVAK